MNFSVTKNGKPVSHHLYDWNEKTKTFSTNENFLVLDFRGIDGVTFKTGYDCAFKTGSYCTFKTSFGCIFETGSGCTFDTGSGCIFDTLFDCIFKIGSDCTFKTGKNCVVVRRDIFEVIKLIKNKKIKLNGYQISGFTYVKDVKDTKTIIVDGKECEISLESFENIQKEINN